MLHTFRRCPICYILGTEEPSWCLRSIYLCDLGWVTWSLPSHAATAKSLQSCPILCNPIDGSPPGSPVPGILQARLLEWVAISFSNAWKWKVKVKSLSCVRLFTIPWTAAYQAPPPMGFSRQEYWSGVPLPSPLPSHSFLKLEIISSCFIYFTVSLCQPHEIHM